MTSNNPLQDSFYRTVENELWSLYKYFPAESINLFDDMACAAFIHDSIKKRSSTDLQSIDEISKRVHTLREYRNQLQVLLDTPQVAQRSPEWYDLRKERLTASATAQAIGKGKFGNRKQLLQSKAFPENDKWAPQTTGPMYHGTMLEAMTSRCYSQRNNDMRIYDFGMIKHPGLSCFGASPDGISEMGIMIEIKTPYRRAVDGNIPEEYMLQMQGQMAACGFLECEFVDCKIDIIQSENAYIEGTLWNGKVDHGIIVEHRDERGNPTFEYSPEYLSSNECIEWKNKYIKNNKCTKFTYWKLYKLIATRVYFDEKLWNDLVPQIEEFWKDVLALRANPSIANTTAPKKRGAGADSPKKTRTFDFIDSDED
jgi:putative phage-type endonuclease